MYITSILCEPILFYFNLSSANKIPTKIKMVKNGQLRKQINSRGVFVVLKDLSIGMCIGRQVKLEEECLLDEWERGAGWMSRGQASS